MKKFLTLILTSITTLSAFSQDIDFDKSTGLVKVNGRDSFYLIKTNKAFLNYDMSFQNINKEELAYFAVKKVEDLPWSERGSHIGTYFRLTFTETANTANIFPESFSVPKQMAKLILNSHLLIDNKINPKSERAFIISNNGTINKEPDQQPITVVVNTAPAANNTADILIKENKIYNNSELVGSFKKSTDANNITTVSIYNKDDSKVATAIHNDADANADWNLTTTSDGKTTQLLYNSNAALEKLFKYLAEKGFL